MFSIVHAVLLRPMALPAGDRVVMLWSVDVRHDVVMESTYETQADFRARLRSFDDVALIGSVNWGGTLLIPGRDPVHLSAAVVSGTFFQVLGSSALLGRVFDAKDDDPQAERRLVLSHAAWTQFFGADPAVIGRKVMLREEANPQSFEVIGVMPPEFFFPRGAQYWATAAPRLEAIARHTGQPRADLFGKLGVFYALGRLKPGVSVDDARREMPSYLKSVADQFRIDLTNFQIVVTPLVDFIFGPARQTLWLLMAAVVLVLLIACGNVAGLVFARGASRRREIAVRAALGASRGVLIRQLLAESALIACAGALLGVAGAAAVLEALVALSPADIPRLDDTGINLPVVLFAIATALVATVLVGLVPALRASRTSLVDDMKNGTMGAGQAAAPGRGALVAVQVAGTLVLLDRDRPVPAQLREAGGSRPRVQSSAGPHVLGQRSQRGAVSEPRRQARRRRPPARERRTAAAGPQRWRGLPASLRARADRHGLQRAARRTGGYARRNQSQRRAELGIGDATLFRVDEHQAAARTHLRRARQCGCRAERHRQRGDRQSSVAGPGPARQAPASLIHRGRPLAHGGRCCRHRTLPGDRQPALRYLCRDAAVHERREALHRPHNRRSSELPPPRSTRQSRTWTHACQSAA